MNSIDTVHDGLEPVPGGQDHRSLHGSPDAQQHPHYLTDYSSSPIRHACATTKLVARHVVEVTPTVHHLSATSVIALRAGIIEMFSRDEACLADTLRLNLAEDNIELSEGGMVEMEQIAADDDVDADLAIDFGAHAKIDREDTWRLAA